jgi:adenosylhomocysteine nucleosidase
VQTGERTPVVLATAEEIASLKEKLRLFATYRALAVDMEAATVARLARAHGVGFRAIKGISDSLDVELKPLGDFTGKFGSFRTGAFALHTALRPWTWLETVALGRGSAKALGALDEVLKGVIATYRNGL